mmetsp:Transcript_45624/g.129071  ORF Transcript_45624/g.129071 Transcript_45624/m.129071 type:complete len:528 (+) Transcript_45624:80-1663(+)
MDPQEQAEEEVPEEELPEELAEGEEGEGLEAEELAEEGDAEAEPEAEEEEDLLAEEGVAVEDHLKEAIQDQVRLKRMLSRDGAEDGGDGSKRRKVDGDDHRPIVQAKIKQILTKWGLQTDAVVKHVLENLSPEELKELETSNYAPDKFNQWKSAAELLARHVCDMKERKMVTGSSHDVVSAFKHRWQLDAASEKTIRALDHKNLRYVLSHYDGTAPLEDVIGDAAMDTPEENTTASALPEAAGVPTMGRFSRLELIDPLADCAVFGDANLTFSLRLAKHRKALGHVGRVIATTFEELETLRERYKEIDEIIKELEDHYAEVYHGVDCTRIAIDPRFAGMEGALGAVYYNFPHSGAIQGFFDGHPVVNWRHENLMRLFFRALRSFVKPGGVVKVSSNMGAVGVRYSYIVGSAVENEFLHAETMSFLEWHLHRYGRSYGDKRDVYKRPDAKNNQSYNAQRAESDMVYCFVYAPSGDPVGRQQVRFPPTLKTLSSCSDGPFKHLMGPAKANLAKQLHKRFVTEISGVHVG